jgi:hypothetical protein
MWHVTVEEDGEVKDRDIDEIALEVAEKALNEWGKAERGAALRQTRTGTAL